MEGRAAGLLWWVREGDESEAVAELSGRGWRRSGLQKSGREDRGAVADRWHSLPPGGSQRGRAAGVHLRKQVRPEPVARGRSGQALGR